MAQVGSTFVSVMPSARGFGRSLDSQIGGDLDSSGKRAGGRFGTALKAGALAVAGGAALLGGFLKGTLDEAREAQKVGALTNAVIKSTGGVANVTAKDVDRLATSISLKTGVDDEAIAAGQNMLLTFANVRNEVGRGNDIFSQATVAATDMAAAFGGDAVSNSKMLGKALNDPVKGVSALTRVGVSFTQQQKDQIGTLVESGRTLDAQKVILGELRKQTEGAAEATATSGDKFKVAFDNMRESIGTAILPLWDRLLDAGASFATVLTNDIGPGIAALNGFLAPVVSQIEKSLGDAFSGGAGGFQSFATSLIGSSNAVRGAIAGIVGAFAPFIASIIPSLVSAGQKITAALLPAIESIANVVSTQLVPTFQKILPILAPIVSFLVGVFATAVVGAIKGIVQAVTGIVNVIAGVVNLVDALIHGQWSAAWGALKQIVVGVVNAVIGIIRAWLNISILKIFSVGLGAIRGLWTKFGTGLTTLARSFLTGILGVFRTILTGIRGAVTGFVGAVRSFWANLFSYLRSAAVAGWNNIKAATSAALNAVKSFVSNGVNAVKNAFQNAMQAVVTAVIGGFNQARNATGNGISGVVSLVSSIPGRVLGAIGNLGGVLYNAGVSLIQGLVNGITSKISAAVDAVQSGLSRIKGLLPGSPIKWGPLKGWNNTGSSGPGGRLVGLLAAGLSDTRPVDSAMERITSRIAVKTGPTLALATTGTAAGGRNAGTVARLHPDDIQTLARELYRSGFDGNAARATSAYAARRAG